MSSSKYRYIIIEPKKNFEFIPLGTFMYVHDNVYNAWMFKMYLDSKTRYWKPTEFSPTARTKSIASIYRLFKPNYRIKKYKSLKELYTKRFEEFL